MRFDYLKIITYRRMSPMTLAKPLIQLTLLEYLQQLASANPTPGGGAVAAISLAQAVSLLSMITQLLLKKNKLPAQPTLLTQLAHTLSEMLHEALTLAERDTQVFNHYLLARQQPASTEIDQQKKMSLIHQALKDAITVPLRVRELSLQLLQPQGIIETLKPLVSPYLKSDWTIAKLLSRCAALAAEENIKINLTQISDTDYNQQIQKHLEEKIPDL